MTPRVQGHHRRPAGLLHPRCPAVMVGLAEDAGPVRRPGAACPTAPRSVFAGFRFPPEVITVAVRWYLRYSLSNRDVEELLAERGMEVNYVTVYRWAQRLPHCSPRRPTVRHASGDRWFVDDTYVKITDRWRCLYRAVDQYGQVIDVLLSEQRDTAAAHRFFLASSCTSEPESYDERMNYLRTVAKRGEDMHILLKSQEAEISKDRCAKAHTGVGSPDIVSDQSGGYEGKAWTEQVRDFFVDSCVSGKPHAVPGDAPPSTGTAPTSSTPTP